MNVLSMLAAGSQLRLRRLAVRAAFAAASGLMAAVGIGFATYALFEAWRLQFGPINAALGLSAIYLVLAALLYLCARRSGSSSAFSAKPALGATSPAGADAIRSGAGPEAAAVAMGIELSKQLTPLQLTLIAALSGFVAGRKL
jgi:hypothetical protein